MASTHRFAKKVFRPPAFGIDLPQPSGPYVIGCVGALFCYGIPLNTQISLTKGSTL
ncbi:MAG TPA: hypothetical protein PLL06_07280 [Acidobacteriota bacterium]|nr:hypothetical protein [Acidobacteriota bacterium]